MGHRQAGTIGVLEILKLRIVKCKEARVYTYFVQ